MVALITSTLIPTNFYSLFNPDERLTQTINTIQKLRDAGFTEIYLFDNSIDKIDTDKLIKAYTPIKIHQTPQYTFKNKGLNEALLILNNIRHLPLNTPIFKISGRYYPTSLFKKEIYYQFQDKDFVGIGYNFQNKIADFSTKAYFVKSVDVLKSTLVIAIEDMISYSKGVHGIKSGLNAIKEIFKPNTGTPYQLSIEQSFARILKEKNNFLLLNKMHIEGFEATSQNKTLFSE